MPCGPRPTSGILGYSTFFGLLATFCLDGCSQPQVTVAAGTGGASNSTSQGGSTSTGGKTGGGGSGGASSGSTGGATGTGGASSGATGGNSAGGSSATGGRTGSGGASAGTGGAGTGGTSGGSSGGATGTGGAGTGGSSADAGKSDAVVADAAADRPKQDVASDVGTATSDVATDSSACVGSACGSDGCTTTLASNLTLAQIAVYQTVKVPIMTAGSEVAAASRNASVVQGRETMFRAFVTTGSGWTSRDLSARLVLTPAGGTATTYFSKKTITTSSTDADQTNSFQIYVPASDMAASIRYSLQVVECGTTTGTPGAAIFPTTGDIDLGVKNTGGLKVTIIPIQFGTLLPDTSTTGLSGYVSEMTAMYPINAITFTVGTTLTAVDPIDWSGMLDQVRAQRTADKPSADTYYFGLVKPAATLRTYCGSGCTTGIGFVVTSATGTSSASGRAAVGVAFGDAASYSTMAHEIGHNHGRNHVNCVTGGGTITGIDTSYPYPTNTLGSWGYDARTKALIDPSKSTDIMSYCSNQWMSDYTYSAVTTRVAAVNGVTMIYTPPDVVSRWRILLVDSKGPRWGIPVTELIAPDGDPELATVYDAAGNAVATPVVYRTAIADIDASMVMIPEPQAGWASVAVAGSPPTAFAPATP